MNHKRGRRSPKSEEFRKQQKDSRQFIRDQSFFDKVKGESVCLNSVNDVTIHLGFYFKEPIHEAVPDVEPGLVLSSPSGEGAFQMVDLSQGTEMIEV